MGPPQAEALLNQTIIPKRSRPTIAPRLFLAGLTVLLLVGLATPPDPRGIPTEMPPDHSDSALFRAVASRMAGGEAYYPTMRDELVARGYPTGSVANWRTPLYLELVAHAPVALRMLLLLCAVLVLTGTALALRPVSTSALLAGVLFQNGVVVALWVGQLQAMPEPLAGALIALSVLLTLRGWRGTGIVLGTAALFVRELAVPYAAIRLAWAVWARQWREALGWAVGVSGYSVFLLWHAWHVHQAMPAHPVWHTMSWIQFGGLRFVLATMRSNGWLAVLPWWMTPFALAATLLGTWRAPRVLSLSVWGYLIVFGIVGQPFNWYWGWVPGMLMPLILMQIGRCDPVTASGHGG